MLTLSIRLGSWLPTSAISFQPPSAYSCGHGGCAAINLQKSPTIPEKSTSAQKKEKEKALRPVRTSAFTSICVDPFEQEVSVLSFSPLPESKKLTVRCSVGRRRMYNRIDFQIPVMLIRLPSITATNSAEHDMAMVNMKADEKHAGPSLQM